jgi:transposase
VIETAVGEEAQVDYGTGPMVRDPHSGKYRRMRLFVLTLGYSRKSVRLLVFQSSTQTWAELHEQAFGRLGGCTRVVVLDNLGEGALCRGMHREQGETAVRRILGVLSLAKKYGVASVDDACAALL